MVGKAMQLEHERLKHHLEGKFSRGTFNWRICGLAPCPSVMASLTVKNHKRIVLDRETCDWVIDIERDMAACRTRGHGEVCDGVDSERFPGNAKV